MATVSGTWGASYIRDMVLAGFNFWLIMGEVAILFYSIWGMDVKMGEVYMWFSIFMSSIYRLITFQASIIDVLHSTA